MRRLRWGLLVLAVTLPAGWPAPAAAAAPASDVEALVNAANEARARYGLPPLRLSPALTSAATAYGEHSHRVLLLSRGFRYAGAAAVRGRFRGRTSTIWVLRLGGR